MKYFNSTLVADFIINKTYEINGKKKYFKLFNEKRITQYIIDTSLGKKYDLF